MSVVSLVGRLDVPFQTVHRVLHRMSPLFVAHVAHDFSAIQALTLVNKVDIVDDNFFGVVLFLFLLRFLLHGLLISLFSSGVPLFFQFEAISII